MPLSPQYKVIVEQVKKYANEIELDMSETEIRKMLCVLSAFINSWITRERIAIGIDEPGEEDAAIQRRKARDAKV